MPPCAHVGSLQIRKAGLRKPNWGDHPGGVDWNGLAYLLAVSRSGSLSGAARDLGVATSTVSRRLETLEAELSLRLFDRGTEGLSITAAGERIAALAHEAEARVDEIERTATMLREGGSPIVRVSAPESIIHQVLAPAMARLRTETKGVRVDLLADTRVVSLARRDADLAIRLVRPVGSSLVAKRLGSIRLGLFASADYLAGRSADAIELQHEALLGFDDSSGALVEVKWARKQGLEAAMVLRASSTSALLAAASAGAGIAILPIYLARNAGLLPVPAPGPIPARGVWLVMHGDMRRVPVVRAVARWIAQAFAPVCDMG